MYAGPLHPKILEFRRGTVLFHVDFELSKKTLEALAVPACFENGRSFQLIKLAKHFFFGELISHATSPPV